MAKRAAKATAGDGGKVVEIVTRTTERRTGDEELTELAVETGEPGDDDILAALDDLGDSGARLEIRRTSPAEFAGYVGTYSRDGWTPDRLMEEWGGGKFTIRVRDAAGQFLGLRHLTIAGKSKNKETPQPAALQAQPAQGAGGDLGAVLTAMQKSSDAQIGMLTSLVTGLLNRPVPTPPPAPDPLAMISALKDILKPGKAEGEGSVTMLLKGIELGKSLGGEGGETGFADVMLKGFDMVKSVAATDTTRRPRPAARIAGPAPGTVPAIEAPATPNKQAPKPAQEATPMMKQLQWIKNQTVFLCVQASRQKDPELYAELFLDNLPDFLPEQTVHEQMTAEGAVAKLAQLVPDVLKYPEWFEEFRQEVVSLLEEDQDPADPDEEVDRLAEGGEGGEGGAVFEHEPAPEPPGEGGGA